MAKKAYDIPLGLARFASMVSVQDFENDVDEKRKLHFQIPIKIPLGIFVNQHNKKRDLERNYQSLLAKKPC